MKTSHNFRQIKVSSKEADQKDSGWYGPLQLDSNTAEWIQNSLDEHNLDLVVGIQPGEAESYVKVAPKPQEVESSMIDNVAYDEAASQLTVTFKAGSTYRYHDVEKPIFEGLTQATSKGRFFLRHVRPWYKYERVKN